MIEYLNQNQGFATSAAAFLSFVATAILAIITFFYARYTKQIADRSDDPQVTAWVYPRAPNLIVFRVGNTGSGPAIRLEVEAVFDKSGDRSIVWEWPLLEAGESHDFRFPSVDQDGWAFSVDDIKALGNLEFTANFRTVGGRKRSTAQTIDLERVLDSTATAKMFVTDDDPDRIALSTRNEIRKVRESIDRLASAVERRE